MRNVKSTPKVTSFRLPGIGEEGKDGREDDMRATWMEMLMRHKLHNDTDENERYQMA